MVLYKVVVFKNYNSPLSQVYCVITAAFSLLFSRTYLVIPELTQELEVWQSRQGRYLGLM